MNRRNFFKSTALVIAGVSASALADQIENLELVESSVMQKTNGMRSKVYAGDVKIEFGKNPAHDAKYRLHLLSQTKLVLGKEGI
jgi:hypothetical protein